MKKALYYLGVYILSISLLCSCGKDEGPDKMEVEQCGVSNPMVDLAWLSDQESNCFADIDCKSYFYTAVYDNKQIFYNELSGSFCDPIFNIILYNCDGQQVKQYGENEKTQFNTEVTEVDLLAICE